MKNRTFFFQFKPFFKFLLAFAFFVPFSNILCAEHFGIASVENESVGLIGAATVFENSIYIGAENGLFELTGEYIEQLDSNSSVLAGGYISSLDVNHNLLWLTLYGKGIYSYNMDSSELVHFPIDSHFDEYFWTVRVSDNVVLATFLSGFVLFDLDEKTIVSETYLDDLSGLQNDEIKAVTKGENGFFILTSSGLVTVDFKTYKLKYVSNDKLAPKLDSPSAIHLSNSQLLIAGRNGVVVLEESSLEEIRFLFFDKPASLDTSAVMQNSENRILVAAGSLYSEENGKLKKAGFLQPLLDASHISSVSSLMQMPDGQIVLSSTQRGLLTLPSTYNALNFISLDGIKFPNNIFDQVLLRGSTYVLASDSGYYLLNSESGRLSTIAKYELSKSKLLKTEDGIIDLLNCTIVVSNPNTPITDRLFDIDLCQKQIVKNQKNDIQALLIKSEIESQVLVYSSKGRLLSQKKVPHSIYAFDLDANNEIVGVNEKNELLIENNGIWTKHKLPFPPSLSFSCLKTDSSFIYLCSSGYGLIRLDRSNSFEHEIIKTPSNSRYIRDISINNEDILIASNKGLSIINTNDGQGTDLGKNQGFYDRDYSFNGIYELSNKNYLISGDNLSYLVDLAVLTESLNTDVKTNRLVKVISADLDERSIRNPFSSNKILSIGSRIESASIDVGLASLLENRNLAIEYKISDSNWITTNNSFLKIQLRNLKYGRHDIYLRAANLQSGMKYGESKFSLDLIPPFYLSKEAKIVYFFLLILTLFLSTKFYRHFLILRARANEKRVQDKLIALKESSEVMEQMLKSKHAAMTHISHEIRTPLMLVTEPLKNVAKRITDKKILEDIEVIDRNAQRVSTLVDQLLEIERLSGIRNVPLHKYNIKESCQYLVESIRPLAEQKEQTLKLRLSATGDIFLIQDTLQQIFYNLLSNAVKYSPSATDITVTTKIEGDVLFISVEDQGPGLSDSDLKSVFSRFSRLDNSHKQKGLGLGLSLLKQLVKANKGHIDIISGKKSGARFEISLPIKSPTDDINVQQIDEYKNQPSLDFSEAVEKKKNAQLPVMVIADDSKDFREHLLKLFEDDYLCFVVKDGKEALKAVEILEPDVLLTDYAMPKMTGVELVRKIRSNDKYVGLTIYILSALRDKEIVQQAHDLMLDDYIYKPFDQELFRQKVNNRLAAKQNEKLHVSKEKDSSFFLGLNPALDGEKDHQFFINFRECLESNVADQGFSRELCAARLFISERQLNRKLQMIIGQSFSDTLKQYRIDMAKQKLIGGSSVTDTAFDCGFSNPSYFSTIFKAETGLTPTEFAKQQSEATLS